MTENHTAEPRRLLHRRSELVRRHERATERVALFPNAVNRRQLVELASEIAAIEQRMRALGVDDAAFAA